MTPAKPTRDDAVSSPGTAEMEARARSGGAPPAAAAKGREERGSAAENAKHPPHVTDNAENAPVQGNHGHAGETPVLPPNAQGQDRLSTTEHQQSIDEESMYDRRPEEDKDRPPSSPTTP